MAFGQAFATAFLNGLTGQIQERTREAKEERKRRERIAETAGLQQYLKRQANFNKYLNIAKKIQKLGDPDGTNEETKQNIAKLATSPELLLAANTYIDNFSKKFPNIKITPARINGFISNIDLVMPEGGMSLEEAAKRAAGLVVQNTNLEEEKKDPNAMENNIFMTLLGVGAEKRELEKLKSKKVGQGFSTYDLYTMAMGGDYTPLDQATGSLDYSYFPTPFNTAEQSLERKNIEANTIKGIEAEITRLNRMEKQGQTNFVDSKGETKNIADALSQLTLQRDAYADRGAGASVLEARYAAKSLADDILSKQKLEPFMALGGTDNSLKLAALQILIDSPEAINTFGEENIKRQAKLLGGEVRKTGQVVTDQDDKDLSATNVTGQKKSNVDSDQDKAQDQRKQVAMKEVVENPLEKVGNQTFIDYVVENFGRDALPATIAGFKNVQRGDLQRPRTNDAEAKQWDKTWGKHYNPDGTRK
tara:strand:+ start:342 stop:1769 length:1428 start_codon:yes stop_codon:yes gene_type:complete